MSKTVKIYDDDPEVYAHTTNIKADRTKAEIDGLLARFGIKDVWWRYDIPHNDVFIRFILSEKFGDETKDLTVKLDPPRIWHKDKHSETINWNVSMRNLYWYILTHLSQAYVNQSSKFQEFLPNILGVGDKKLVELFKTEMVALPAEIKNEKTVRILEMEKR